MHFLKYIPVLLIFFLTVDDITAQKKQWTLEDMMRFESLDNPVISENARWVAHGASPDRGDGRVVFYRVRGDQKFKIERGERPMLNRDGRWGGAFVAPAFRDQMLKKREELPDHAFTLLNLSNGQMNEYESVNNALFTNNGNWLVMHHTKADKDDLGSKLTLKYLRTGDRFEYENVTAFTVDSLSTALIFADADTTLHARLQVRPLRTEGEAKVIHEGDSLEYLNFSWHENLQKLAFLAGREEHRNQDSDVFVYDLRSDDLSQKNLYDKFGDEYTLNASSIIDWRRDGTAFFIGLSTRIPIENNEIDDEDVDLFDFDYILSEKELDVWHWNDPLIKTHEKETYTRRSRQTHLAKYSFSDDNLLILASDDLPEVFPDPVAGFLLGRTPEPYQKRISWEGWFNDFYLVNVSDGSRLRFGKELGSQVNVSPYGSKVVYFDDGHWHLFDAATQTYTNLTDGLPVSFANEDHDRTSPPNGYGVAAWMEGDRFVLIYDKYDIWQFDTSAGASEKLTDGRTGNLQFRIINTDRDRKYVNRRETLLLSSYHEREKYHGFYSMQAGREGTARLLEDRKRFRFLQTADDNDLILFTREDYREFGNLWVADRRFRNPERVTDMNLHIDEYNWGHAELIEWKDLDGWPTQGILIKPEDYDPDKKYPVMVYYYERFSQRLHHFNEQVINHRPSFPFYVSSGYIVFLPDVWFRDGLPGPSAVKSLVPGVQKLIADGIAHPDQIGLHGHSWSGYLSAYVVTQTDIFAAAVAGAPVSNMTSAYSGIRWGTGLTRQFQYETGQSRIGGSLWEKRDLYIENSPVFYADRINTPLLIQFGDKDEAVPWEQGIELYMALRRNQKDAIMLQYRGEPHHLRKYAHKLDYTIKMMEYFDHYVRGHEAPEWISDGIPYAE